jgi:cation:H+ antiporter
MAVALEIFLFVGGLTVALLASSRAVDYTRALAAALGAPSFVVGVALVSIGTDLPELANAVAAHLKDEGDVNVGTAVGSALVQYTFVVGLFPLIIAIIPIARRQVVPVSVLTVAGLGLATLTVADGRLTRPEGLGLVLAWAAFLLIIVRMTPGLVHDEPPKVRFQNRFGQVGIVLFTLALVGLGATIAVEALVGLAEEFGVPEYLLGFFGASIGTSAPELVVDLTALMRGAPGIAFGDAFGSSLVDATLTIGVGGLVKPADISTGLAVTGAVYSMVAVGVVGAMLAIRRRHDRVSGGVFVGLYFAAYAVLIGLN